MAVKGLTGPFQKDMLAVKLNILCTGIVAVMVPKNQ